jgi:hypothetical protein
MRAGFEPFALLVHDLHCVHAHAHQHGHAHLSNACSVSSCGSMSECMQVLAGREGATYVRSHGRKTQERDRRRSRGQERAVCVCVSHTQHIFVCVRVSRAHLNHPPADQGDILLLEVERDAPERDARYASTHPHRYASTHPHRYASTHPHTHTHVSAHTCTRPSM